MAVVFYCVLIDVRRELVVSEVAHWRVFLSRYVIAFEEDVSNNLCVD